MELYFLRHGVSVSQADWAGDDGQRPLTEAGKVAMAREAATLARLGLRPDVIVTSPLVRARQTAEIVAAGLEATDRLESDGRLAEGFGPKRLRKVLRAHKDARHIMLVGHEPDFSRTIGKLTGGRLLCSKGGLARVDLADVEDRQGELLWLWQADQLVGDALGCTVPSARPDSEQAEAA